MKTSNQLIGSLAITLLAHVASPLQAMPGDSERAELQDELRQCENALRARFGNPEQHRIYQRPGTAISNSEVVFWINSSILQAGKKVAIKSRCISGIDGDLVSLKIAAGHWNQANTGRAWQKNQDMALTNTRQ